MERETKRRRTELLAESTGPGDAETEFVLENELCEEREHYWYEGVFTTQDHLPPSQDSLNEAEDVIMYDSPWSDTTEEDLVQLAQYDLHDEEVHLSRVGGEGKTAVEDSAGIWICYGRGRHQSGQI